MTYFVTGATGFIGRFLGARLVERGGTIHVLVRKGSVKKLEELRGRWGVDDGRIIAMVGDLAKPKLGLSAADVAGLKGKVKHFFHLAAITTSADAESQRDPACRRAQGDADPAEHGFRMFPDSGAAKGKKGEAAKEVELTPEQIAFAQITQGIHW